MAAVSSSKWTSFYNDPPPSDYNEEDDTSTGEFFTLFLPLTVPPFSICSPAPSFVGEGAIMVVVSRFKWTHE